MSQSDLDTLSDGLNSPFWEWFKAEKDREWGPGGERYQQAVRHAAAMKDENAVHTLRMIIFAQQEIERLFMRPVERLNQLRHEAKVHGRMGASRRGPGL